MSFYTADISIQLLIDTTNTLQEIESRMTARAFGAVHSPEIGPEVQRVLIALLEVLDRTSPDGVIRPTTGSTRPHHSVRCCFLLLNQLLRIEEVRLPIRERAMKEPDAGSVQPLSNRG
ncbi:hypothetical protein [Synechococcus sp. CCY 0621]|uniref:hypothetical protein n=1 Tax=Synechococcus sp. CCY 0621 TaxID=2815603 RepID=UPI00256FD02F|nr:hypothetical protein [Synechococcus sp. CCY 0621]